MRTYRTLLSGLGNVGRSFIELIPSQAEVLASRHGIELLVVGAADSGGVALDPAGLDLAALIATKRARASVAGLSGVGRPGMSAVEMMQSAGGDVYDRDEDPTPSKVEQVPYLAREVDRWRQDRSGNSSRFATISAWR